MVPDSESVTPKKTSENLTGKDFNMLNLIELMHPEYKFGVDKNFFFFSNRIVWLWLSNVLVMTTKFLAKKLKCKCNLHIGSEVVNLDFRIGPQSIFGTRDTAEKIGKFCI